MKSIGAYIQSSLQGMGIDPQKIAYAQKVARVRDMWSKLVEQEILDHTNAVYVVDESDHQIMHVYVDESIYAAELNNRREFISLLCREKYGQYIDQFHIHISKGNMKRRYPFRRTNAPVQESRPLTTQEVQKVVSWAQPIPNDGVRESFTRAFKADLEWKKASNDIFAG